jgi:hypothetical protein
MLETINQISNQLLPFLGICFVITYVYMLIKPFHNLYSKK